MEDNAPNADIVTDNHLNGNESSQKSGKGFEEEMFEDGLPDFDDEIPDKEKALKKRKGTENLLDDEAEDEEDDLFNDRPSKKKPRNSDEEEEISYSEGELGLEDEDEFGVRSNRSKRTKSQPLPDDDVKVQMFIEKMERAYHEDKEANRNKQPALSKLKLLPEVLSLFQKQNVRDSYFDGGFLKQCKNWLTPLPDGTLPNLKIREGILKSLEKLELSEELLRASGIGRAVMSLSKHKSESLTNQKICSALISKWSRPIFDISSTYKELEKYEKEASVHPVNSSKKPRKKSSSIGASLDPLDISSSQEALPSYTIRPQKVRMEYSIRPPSWGDDMKKEKGTPTHSKPNKIQERITALRASKRAKTRAVSVGVNKPTRNT